MKKNPRSGLPRYTAAERRERARYIRSLRDEAVRSWTRDPFGETAIVILTFARFSQLVYPAPRRNARKG